LSHLVRFLTPLFFLFSTSFSFLPSSQAQIEVPFSDKERIETGFSPVDQIHTSPLAWRSVCPPCLKRPLRQKIRPSFPPLPQSLSPPFTSRNPGDAVRIPLTLNGQSILPPKRERDLLPLPALIVAFPTFICGKKPNFSLPAQAKESQSTPLTFYLTPPFLPLLYCKCGKGRPPTTTVLKGSTRVRSPPFFSPPLSNRPPVPPS